VDVVHTLAFTFRLMWAVIVAVVARVVRRLKRGPVVPGWRWSTELSVVAMRAFIMEAATHPDPRARNRLEAALDPPLPKRLRSLVRIEHRPVGGRPAEWHICDLPAGADDAVTLLYLHGGGYIAGNPATHRRFVAALAWELGATAVVPDYRLAPAHRFPAALDDSVAAYRELVAGGVDPDSILIGGDSAGGGLAMAMLLRLRDEGEPLPAGALLFSPYVDLEHTGPSIAANQATDYLPLGVVRPNFEYVGAHDPRDPHASPLYGDFHGIPPLLILGGEREMILDDAVRLAARAEAAGVVTALHLGRDMPHVWPAVLPTEPETLRALAACRTFVTHLVKR
jgi:acetyl esterase/lipase